MSRPRKKRTNRKPHGSNRSVHAVRTILILVLVGTAGLCGLWLWNAKHRDAKPAGPSSAAVYGFERLEGKWLRPDGGYVLEVRGVDSTGSVDAQYLNPRPIRVAKAQASQDGSLLKLSVELRDVNYPGSTYNLTYRPATDELAGNYFQAALGQTFEVVFQRAN